MPADELMRSLSVALVRFTGFVANGLLFGLVPILLLVLRPSFVSLDQERWGPGRRRAGERLESLFRVALTASLTATLVLLALQAALTAEFHGGDVDGSAFSSVFATRFGMWHLLRIPLVVGIAVMVTGRLRSGALVPEGSGTKAPGGVLWAMWALLGLVLLATSSFSGHAAAPSPLVLALANDLVHLAAGAVWFTGIVVLAVVVPETWSGRARTERLELLAPMVVRFSDVALIAIGIVGITGVVNSWLNVGAVVDLAATGYGRTLSFKIVLFLGVLALGWFQHRRIRRRLQADLERSEPGPALRLFRKTMAAELAIALGLMAATGLLTNLGRTRPSSGATPVVTSQPHLG